MTQKAGFPVQGGAENASSSARYDIDYEFLLLTKFRKPPNESVEQVHQPVVLNRSLEIEFIPAITYRTTREYAGST